MVLDGLSSSERDTHEAFLSRVKLSTTAAFTPAPRPNKRTGSRYEDEIESPDIGEKF